MSKLDQMLNHEVFTAFNAAANVREGKEIEIKRDRQSRIYVGMGGARDDEKDLDAFEIQVYYPLLEEAKERLRSITETE